MWMWLVLACAGNGVPAPPAPNVESSHATPAIQREPAVSGEGATTPSLPPFERILARFSGHLRYCYDTHLQTDPTLAGRIELRVEVRDESAESVAVVGDTMLSESMVDCVKSKVYRWKFVDVEDGSYTQPFVFAADD